VALVLLVGGVVAGALYGAGVLEEAGVQSYTCAPRGRDCQLPGGVCDSANPPPPAGGAALMPSFWWASSVKNGSRVSRIWNGQKLRASYRRTGEGQG